MAILYLAPSARTSRWGSIGAHRGGPAVTDRPLIGDCTVRAAIALQPARGRYDVAMARNRHRSLLLLVVGALAACGGAQKPAADEPGPSWVRGARTQSPSLKASETRPRPFTEERGPFQEDRLELQAHEARRRQHQETHGEQAPVMESFDHPACAGLDALARRSCPLVSIHWTDVRDIDGGIALRVSGVDPDLLRRRVLCHIAFGRVVGSKDDCPLHLPGVRASVVAKDPGVELRVIALDPGQVSELRRRLRALVR